jgi:hypothetical protein
MYDLTSTKKIKILYRTYGDRVYREERAMNNIPAPGDDVVFEDGEWFRVISRTFLTEVLTGEVICDIYLEKPEATHD